MPGGDHHKHSRKHGRNNTTGNWKHKNDRKPNKKPRNNHVWREEDAKIHPGSYAHETQRQILNVSLPVVAQQGDNTIKRKVAMLIGYKGTSYSGFQINEEQKTIQAELELAMYAAGMVRPENFGVPYKYAWSTSGRTDKGVHAAAQTISCKVELMAAPCDLEQGKQDESNDNNEKEQGEPKEEEAAKVGSSEEVKAKVDDTKKPSIDKEGKSGGHEPPKKLAEDALELARERMNAALPDAITVMSIQRTTRGFCAKTHRDKVRYHYLLPAYMISKHTSELLNALIPKEETRDEKDPFSSQEMETLRTHAKDIRSTPEQRQRLQTALQKYIGTRSFHNFTKGLTHDNASATRYIMAFDVHEPVYDTASQMEWIPTTVTGQSFLIHQIRKMIAAAMEIARESVSDDYIERALDAKQHVPVPIAPATGLFLEQSWYDAYNRRKNHAAVGNKTAEGIPDLDWSQEGPVLERWKECVASIQKHIMMEEQEQGNYWRYLYIQDRIFYKRYKEDEDQSKSLEVAEPPKSVDSTDENAAGDATELTSNEA